MRAVPFSPWQRGILFAERLDPGGVAYNMGFVVRFLAGAPPVDRLRGRCAELTARHPELRARFDPAGKWIGRDDEPDLLVLPAADLEQRCTAEMGTPFDLAAGPPIRFRVFVSAGGPVALLVVVHHAVFDDRSKDLLVDALCGAPPPDAPTGASMPREAAPRDLTRGPIPELALPTSVPTAGMRTSAGGEVGFALGTAQVGAAADALGCTPFELQLAALVALLRRYGNPEPLVTVIAGTRTAAEASALGCFVNPVPVLVDAREGGTFADFVARTRAAVAGAWRRRDVPLPDLVETVRPWRSERVNGIFQIAMTFVSCPPRQRTIDGATIEVEDLPAQGAKAPLLVGVRSDGTTDRVRIEYASDLFDHDTGERIGGHYRTLLADAVARPDARVEELRIIGAAERARILAAGRGARRAMREETVVDIVAARAATAPDAVAVVAGDTSLTHRELQERANRLGHHLRALGVGPDVLVALCLERGADMVVGALAVLAAGGAYVPMDPDYPRDRLAFMLADSGARVLLTQAELTDRIPRGDAHVVHIDADAGEWSARPATRPESGATAAGLAYVIYTSGSTGVPKGVMIEHRSLVNLLGDFVPRLGLGPRDAWVAVTTLSFDIAALELLAPLAAGATLVIARPGEAADPDALAALLARSGATVLQATPTLWRMLADAGCPWLEGLTALCGGEALPAELAARIAARTAALWNVYGPTETTVWSTAARVSRDVDGAPPIGRSLANTTLLVLDPESRLVPDGVAGELHIGGAGLARGYLGRPELTAERFVSTRWGRLYRTGDLVRRRADGQLEFLGRLDHQVKVRGHRIECGEVEAALTSHPAVDEAVVVPAPDADGKTRLVAYAAPLSGATTGELLAHLRGRLPVWMLPSAVVALERLPRTPNGKVDRGALPAAEAGRPRGEPRVAARTATERMLMVLWGELLGQDEVGLRDDFFALGGHSLLALRIAARLRDRVGAELTLPALFAHPTIEALAAVLDEERAGATAAPPPISPRRDRADPSLSFAQERLWVLDQLQPGAAGYSMQLGVRLTGALDLPRLERALQDVVARHEALRTTFPTRAGRPYQRIDPPAAIPVPVTDLADRGRGPALADARRLAAEEARRPFDLAAGPLLRARIAAIGPHEHVLVLTLHHIVADGWSLGVMRRELGACYRGEPLPPLPVQYADYAAWQRAWLQAAPPREQLGHWRRRLAGMATLELPFDRPRPPQQTYAGAAHPLTLRRALVDRLAAVGRDGGATPYMTLLAAFALLLSRYSGQADVAVGVPVAGRPRTELEPLIGCFVNPLVVRADLSGSPTFETLLDQVRDATLQAFANQDVPFERVVAELEPARDLSRHPLFDVMFTFETGADEPLDLAPLAVEPFDTDTVATRFDLELRLGEHADGIDGCLVYSTDLLDAATVERLATHFRNLLAAIARDPARPVAALELLGDAERRRLVVELNRTAAPYPDRATVPELVERQADRTPEAPAVIAAGETLSYAELDRAANRLAHALRAHGIGPGELVAVALPRSPALVVTLLAVLKAGGAYVPLEPGYPAERLRFMVSDSGARVLVGESSLLGTLPAIDGPVAVVDRDRAALARRPATRPAPAAGPDDLAYVLYTSGSTGTPKGVEGAHRGLVNRLDWMQSAFCLDASDRVLQKTPIGFDVAGWEVFWPLIAGATVVLAAPGRHGDPPYLRRLMDEQRVSVTHFVPSMLQAFLAVVGSVPRPSALRLVVCSGEALSPALVERALQWCGDAELHNLYGPTEASIDVSAWRCEPRADGRVPIGRPIQNMELYVLDEELSPVPSGVPGELYIGGIGLARGYRGRPDLTAERFVPDPFGTPGTRLYRTGDLARHLPDGTLDYLGRLDGQVKIRGVRIELGEIEATLCRHPDVDDAVVVARDEPAGRRLVAYTVSRGTPPDDLRPFLARTLPDQMLPAAFVALDALPLTPNGKLDRPALPEPEAVGDPGAAHAEPRTQTEAVLARIWSRVLRVERVGIHDNFFASGGDSILAIEIVAHAAAAGLELELRQFFTHQTVARLAEVAAPAVAAQAAPVPAGGPVTLTPIQRWLLDQDLPDPHHFNQAFLFALAPGTAPARLEAALAAVVAHHDALRLRFVRGPDGWRSEIAETEPARLLGGPDGKPTDAALDSVQASLGLAGGPLLRAAWFDGDEGPRLLVVVHHLAVDAVSWRVLVQDLATAYRDGGAALPARTTSFQAWAEQLAVRARSREVTGELDLWRRMAASAPELPLDRPPTGSDATAAEAVVVDGLDEDDTAALLGPVGAAYRTRVEDALVCALAQVLTEWAGSEEVTIDLEGHGREDVGGGLDVSRTVGWFTSLYPVRLALAPGGGEGDALVSVKEQLRAVPGRGIGFGLLRHLHPDAEVRSALAGPGPPVVFNYVGRWRESMLADAALLRPLAGPTGAMVAAENPRAHVLEVIASVHDGRLEVAWRYSERLHGRSTVEGLAAAYVRRLRAIVAHCTSVQAGGSTPSDYPLWSLLRPRQGANSVASSTD